MMKAWKEDSRQIAKLVFCRKENAYYISILFFVNTIYLYIYKKVDYIPLFFFFFFFCRQLFPSSPAAGRSLSVTPHFYIKICKFK